MDTSNTTIPTIILCGGMGTRLKEETEFKPKPNASSIGNLTTPSNPQ